MELNELKSRFFNVFKTETSKEVQLFFAPGRINLIGEHIDYNGGFVFPAAITFGTYAAVTPREDSKVVLYSENFAKEGVIECEVTDLARKTDEPWSVYVKGVIAVFMEAGYEMKQGFNAYIAGNIPSGAGLSSSASLEVLIGLILSDLNGFEIDGITNAKLGQKAENDYVGVNCGIMDQFAIAMGKKDQAIKLNTNDLSYAYADCDLQDYRILIMNTNKQRELADSKYNERRAECEAALALLQGTSNLNALCELTVAEFDRVSEVLVKENLYKRAKHAITENERVKLAIQALANRDLVAFGDLLDQSHLSLRDDYEVTGAELDTIVMLTRQQEGVLGARMTGAGFGGCAIALVHQDQLEAVKAAVAKGYVEKVGYEADFYVAAIGDGAKKLEVV
ncbi:MAG: galactokinase [Turicibacter sp.]|nr:galactokinase [Turicibacter sp.]